MLQPENREYDSQDYGAENTNFLAEPWSYKDKPLPTWTKQWTCPQCDHVSVVHVHQVIEINFTVSMGTVQCECGQNHANQPSPLAGHAKGCGAIFHFDHADLVKAKQAAAVPPLPSSGGGQP
ncbi:hypothetical protein [Deinococcus ruber]|uniref:Uncharacterized protein n=1 Tax=Deinococcus ruber TaxID=1848197 RepID=A0A918CN61_9DEIO|nr:hypothetical protein [Deinococcus ruber]GGR33053.1 hypothetical protein GCM10008957_49300 [Deinococcus ruber]